MKITPQAAAVKPITPELPDEPARQWYVTTGTNIAGQRWVADEKTGRSIAVAYDGSDAPLIAAAPELLAACQHALDSFGGVRPDSYAAASRKEFDMLSSAIAKATSRD